MWFYLTAFAFGAILYRVPALRKIVLVVVVLALMYFFLPAKAIIFLGVVWGILALYILIQAIRQFKRNRLL